MKSTEPTLDDSNQLSINDHKHDGVSTDIGRGNGDGHGYGDDIAVSMIN